MVRNMDELGRVVIPIEWRRELNMNQGDPIEIAKDGNSIKIKKYNPGCTCCGKITKTVEVDGVRLCWNCIEKINKVADIILK